MDHLMQPAAAESRRVALDECAGTRRIAGDAMRQAAARVLGHADLTVRHFWHRLGLSRQALDRLAAGVIGTVPKP